MKFTKFMFVVKNCRKSVLSSEQFFPVVVVRGDVMTISSEIEKNNRKSRKRDTSIAISFVSSFNLSVFELGLILALFRYKEVPSDYARYHNTIRGKEFIAQLDILYEGI